MAIGLFMNNTEQRLEVLELWPDGGSIMIEFNDYLLDLGKCSYEGYSTIHNNILVDTIHEDDLEWEKEYVTAELTLTNDENHYFSEIKKYSNMRKILDRKIDLKNVTRIGITDSFDISATEDGGNYISIKKNKYFKIYLSVFANQDKTHVIFLGVLIK